MFCGHESHAPPKFPIIRKEKSTSWRIFLCVHHIGAAFESDADFLINNSNDSASRAIFETIWGILVIRSEKFLFAIFVTPSTIRPTFSHYPSTNLCVCWRSGSHKNRLDAICRAHDDVLMTNYMHLPWSSWSSARAACIIFSVLVHIHHIGEWWREIPSAVSVWDRNLDNLSLLYRYTRYNSFERVFVWLFCLINAQFAFFSLSLQLLLFFSFQKSLNGRSLNGFYYSSRLSNQPQSLSQIKQCCIFFWFQKEIPKKRFRLLSEFCLFAADWKCVLNSLWPVSRLEMSYTNFQI